MGHGHGEKEREGEREGLRISPGMIGCGGRHTKLHCLVWGSTALHEGVFLLIRLLLGGVLVSCVVM